jgi:hypothetical protein
MPAPLVFVPRSANHAGGSDGQKADGEGAEPRDPDAGAPEAMSQGAVESPFWLSE